MSRALLDINVLIALMDADHADHSRARAWLESEFKAGWASCAITQNGVVRILSQPNYPSPVTPYQAIERLERATATKHHEFWSCAVSLLDDQIVDRSRLLGPRQVTDAYLLALAVANGARFVTFDQSIQLDSVHGAEDANLIVL